MPSIPPEGAGRIPPEEEYRYLFEESPVSLVVASVEGRILRANAAFAEFIGRPLETLVGLDVTALSLHEDVPRLAEARQLLLAGEAKSHTLEKRYVRGDGAVATGLLTMRLGSDREGRRVYVAHIVDIGARKAAEDLLRHGSLHDPLTGLPNRALFLDRLGQAQLRGDSQMVAVVGLDRFRAINEAYGHTVGDRLLVEVARRLERIVARGDTVARVGSDEFGVITSSGVDLLTAVRDVRLPVPAGSEDPSEPLVVTASAGVRPVDPGESPDDQLDDAQLSLYRAKELGRDRVVVFQPALRGRASRQVKIGRGLRRAIEHGELEVHYQPILRASDRSLSGFEALLRWRHPTLGMISPAEFIPVAEAEGLIKPIGMMVLEESLRQLAAWRARGPETHDLTVSINVSTVQVRDSEHMAFFLRKLEGGPVPPNRVKIELTESVFLDRTAEVDATLLAMKAVGVDLVLDDFGTGFSSLNYLQGLPFDGLKLDRSFVFRMTEDGRPGGSSRETARCRSLVRAIAGIARELDMHCVAEGVETEGQRELLVDAGFDYLQGYLFARPAPAGELSVSRRV
jgi:diguanylate cyclase (GGDEF)-like protein/PAS domain S-box-containing protein